MGILRIVVPYLVGFVLYYGARTGADRMFEGSWFDQAGPGVSPPWYFIGNDLVDAVWCTAAAALMLVFSFAAVRRLGSSVWTALAVTLAFLSSHIADGVNIALHTGQVWDASRATTDWTSFESYIQSQDAASTAGLVVTLVAIVGCLVLSARDGRPPGELQRV